MSDIKRYIVYQEGTRQIVKEHPDGRFCYFEDVERLEVETAIEHAKLQSDHTAALEEKDREIERITENAINVMGGQLCEKHLDRVKKMPLNEFHQREVLRGCQDCIWERAEQAEAFIAEKDKRIHSLENDLALSNMIGDAVSRALKGEEVSDFEESFSPVMDAIDLFRKMQQAKAALKAVEGISSC